MSKIAEQLRAKADKMEAKIEAKLNPSCAQQNLTPRRIRMANQMREEGYKLQEQQAGLRAIANLHTVAENRPEGTSTYLHLAYLDKVRNALQIRDILNPYTKVEGEYAETRLLKIGIDTPGKLEIARHDLTRLISEHGTSRPSDKEIELQKRIENLVGTPIPGFFPTPPDVIETMLDIVDDHGIPSDARILEPSAGKGDIADALKERYPNATLSVSEINRQLADILELKGYDVACYDFLGIDVDYDDDKFHAIVMNPPFEKGQDIDHVQHAYTWLETGGILVSIMSEGPFFREDKKALQFREWCSSLPMFESYKLDSGTFGKAFRSTQVATRIVVLYKGA